MPKLLNRLIAGLVFATVFGTGANGQTIAQGFTDHNWYFGSSPYSISFEKTAPFDPYLDSVMTALSIFGNGTASDQVTGALLFYTDGSTIYDASHAPMQGAASQAATVANQGVALSPFPGDNDRYLVFAINAAGNVVFSTVNMAAQGNSTGAGPLGQATSWQPTGLSNVAEAIVVVPKDVLANGYWLLTSETNSTTYHALDIGTGGVGGVVTTTFSGPGIPPLTASHIAVNPTYSVAIAPKEAFKNIQLLDFDAASGNFTFNQLVLNSNTLDMASTEAIYDVLFNLNADFVFASQHGSTTDEAQVYAYDIAGSGNGVGRRPLLSNNVFRSYGLKYGPDRKIYHLYQESSSGPFLVGRIENPGAPVDSLVYTPRVFGGRNFGGRQFPEVLPPKEIIVPQATIMALGTCVQDTTHFFADMDPFTDSFLWSFGDTPPTNSFSVSPGFDYVAPGAYDVSVITGVGGESSTSLILSVNILDTQLMIDLGQDTVICPGEDLPLMIDDSTFPSLNPSTIIWSTGVTGDQSITVNEGGTYWVSGEDALTGCVLYDAIEVTEYGVNTQIANVWYFGGNAGLDFNQQPPIPLDNSLMSAPEGCSAYSDINGDILFYTDGQTVYSVDRLTDTHQIMPNGTGLAGDPTSAQSAMIVQFPADETLFYIFTSQCANPAGACTSFLLSYSIVDLKAAVGGDVVIKNKPLFAYSTERIAAGNFGGVVWLLTHEFGTNTFRSYPIGDLGIGAPVLSTVGSIHARFTQENGEGYMKFSNDGTKVAVAVPSPGSNMVELFDFDFNTGMLSNPVVLDMNSATGKVYGVEFSPNSNWLYATLSNTGGGGTSSIYQWHVDSTTVTGQVTDPDYIINSINQIPQGSTSSALGAIQLGPNSVMYVAIDGSSNLGIINSPDGQQDGTTNATADLTNGQPLAANTSSGLGLPSFIQNESDQTPTPVMTLPNLACVGDTIMYAAFSTSVIDMVQWTIFEPGGGVWADPQNGSTSFVDSVALPFAGDWVFTARIFNRCGLDEIFSSTVTVEDIPMATTGPAAVPLCNQPVTLMPYDSGPQPQYTYLWSTGETTQDISVTETGNYNLVITTPAGCTREYDVFVGPPFGVDLGEDQEICEGQDVTLDAQANANAYIWEVSTDNGVSFQPVTGVGGFNPAGSRFLPTDQINPTLSPGVAHTFRVGVVDPVSPGCIVEDEVIVAVNLDPVVTITSMDVSSCDPAITDGEIRIDEHPTDDLDYVISGPAVMTGIIVSGSGVGTEIISGLPSGVYTVDVLSLVSGCSEVMTVVIMEPTTFDVVDTVTNPDDCDPAVPSGSIVIGLDTNVFPIDYVVNDAMGSPLFSGTNISADTVGNLYFTIPDLLSAGTYSVDVTVPASGCTAFETGIIVDPTPPTDLQGPLSIAECDVSIDLSLFYSSLTSGAIIEWSLDGSAGSYQDASTTPFTTLGESLGVFIKASTSPVVTCDSIMNADIILTPEPIINVVEGTPDCDGFIPLTVEVQNDFAGSQYTYNWTGPGQPTSIGNQSTLNATQDGVYSINVSHSNNIGCFASTTSNFLTVPEAFTATISATPACTDKPFTLTANGNTASAMIPPDQLVFQWFYNGQAVSGVSGQELIRENQPGLYRVEITNSFSCVESNEINIVVNPTTPSLLEPLYEVCFEESGNLELDPGNSFVTYQWFDISDPNNEILLATTPTFTVDRSGLFRADLTNGFQCVTGDAFTVLEDCEAKIIGPNAIRPSSSIDENRVFFLYTEFVDDFEVYLYNRWGELIFQSGDKDFTWNGTLNGTPLPAGSYTYIVKYTKSVGGEGEVLSQYGGVTIIR